MHAFRFAYGRQHFLQAFTGFIRPLNVAVNLIVITLLAYILYAHAEYGNRHQTLVFQGKTYALSDFKIHMATLAKSTRKADRITYRASLATYRTFISNHPDSNTDSNHARQSSYKLPSTFSRWLQQHFHWHIKTSFTSSMAIWILVMVLFVNNADIVRQNRLSTAPSLNSKLSATIDTKFLLQAMIAFMLLSLAYWVMIFLIYVIFGVLAFIMTPLEVVLDHGHIPMITIMLILLPAITQVLGVTQDAFLACHPVYVVDVIARKIGYLSYGFLLIFSLLAVLSLWALNHFFLYQSNLWPGIVALLLVVCACWSYQSGLSGTMEHAFTEANIQQAPAAVDTIEHSSFTSASTPTKLPVQQMFDDPHEQKTADAPTQPVAVDSAPYIQDDPNPARKKSAHTETLINAKIVQTKTSSALPENLKPLILTDKLQQFKHGEYSPDADEVHQLATSAFTQKDSPTVFKLINNFARNNPGHPDIVKNYFLLVKMLFEQRNNVQKAHQIVQHLLKNYPDAPESIEMREYASIIKRVIHDKKHTNKS